MIRRVEEEEPAVGFPSMGLSTTMLRALKQVRYLTPSPIQAAFIPRALDGLDVIGQAKTGTGKTAAFGIPLIEMLEARGRGPQAIILAPTRELTQQIVGELQKLTFGSDVVVCGTFGGEPIERQIRSLTRGVDIVVGTPGRVLDHIERRTLYLGDIVHVVLDEADRMLDIGFRPDIERILRKLPQPRQTMLLSATINADVRKLAQRYMFEPLEVNLSQDEPSVDTIQQFYVSVNTDQKFDLLLLLLKRDRPRQCIVFTRTKRGADRLADRLQQGDQGSFRHSWRSAPDHARPRDEGVSQRADLRARRHRRRRSRYRCRGHQPRHQLRYARRCRKTTSTGSAEPDAWARTASPTCSSVTIRVSRSPRSRA